MCMPRHSLVQKPPGCTDLKCAWSRPGAGVSYEVNRPIEELPTRSQSNEKEYTERRNHCTNGTSNRASFCPRPLDVVNSDYSEKVDKCFAAFIAAVDNRIRRAHAFRGDYLSDEDDV